MFNSIYYKTSKPSKEFANVLVMAFSLMIIYSAVSTAQTFATTLHGKAGSLTLAIVYVVNACTSLFSPLALKKLGVKFCIIIGAACISLYVFVHSLPYYPTLLFSAFLLGFGGALLWSAHALFMKGVSTEFNMPLYSGCFFFMFNMNMILGNSIMGVTQLLSLSMWISFMLLFGFSLVGVLSLFTLQYSVVDKQEVLTATPLPPAAKADSSPSSKSDAEIQLNEVSPRASPLSENVSTSSTETASPAQSWKISVQDSPTIQLLHPSDETSDTVLIAKAPPMAPPKTTTPSELSLVLDSLKKIAQMFIDRRVLITLSLNFFSRYFIAFGYGVIPTKIPTSLVTWSMVFLGVAQTIGSISFGRLTQHMGVRIMLALSFCLNALTIALSFVVFLDEYRSLAGYIAICFTLGLADSGLATLFVPIMSKVFEKQFAESIAAQRVIQCIGFSLGYLSQMYLDYFQIQCCLFGLLVCAAVSMLVLDRFVIALE